MKTLNETTKELNNERSENGCCGGPAPEGSAGCCVEDAEAKIRGEEGCGCGSLSAREKVTASACCGEGIFKMGDAGGTKRDYDDPFVKTPSPDAVRQAVRRQYGRVAAGAGGCGAGQGCGDGLMPDAAAISQGLGYTAEDVGVVPSGANMGLGCGNPQAIANLKPGETVLDLGSGGGFDCFLAVRQVGETGRVIGVDMTPEMVAKAWDNAKRSGYHNVEFRLGEIEQLPVSDATVDVIISNCVINLSPDKRRVFAEAYRVLKPGGRLAISDIVAFQELPDDLRRDMALYTGCMAGASLASEVETMLRAAAFEQVRVVPRDESKTFIRDWAPGTPMTEYVVSASIEAAKPAI
jgi:arsenite methyltransferase